MTLETYFPRGASSSRASKLITVGALSLAAAGIYVQRQTGNAELKYPAKGSFVTAGGARLHYIEKGRGNPVVFLHGNGVTLEDMQISGIIDRAAQSYRAIAFDRPGFGHSERPRGKMWSASEQAKALVDAFSSLGIKQPIVVGHSFATQVALALALNHSSQIGGLVLVSGYYYPTARADVVLFSPPAIPLVGDLLCHTVAPIIGQLMSPKMIREMFAPCDVPSRFTQQFPFPLMFRPSQIRSASDDAVTMVPTAIAFQGRYSELKCPVAIVTGDSDKVVDFKTHSKRLHDQLPESSFESVAGAGHMVHHADQAAIQRAIDDVTARGTHS